MLKRIAGLFGGKGRPDERRSSPRLKVRFSLTVSRGLEELPGMGLDLSLNGCLIAMQHPPSAEQFKAVLEINERRVPVNLNAVRTGTTDIDGTKFTTLGCSFSGVARDDYQVIVTFHKTINAGR